MKNTQATEPTNPDEEVLSAVLSEFIAAYYQAVPSSLVPRDPRLFSWSWHASRRLRFSAVPQKTAEELYEVNVIAILLNVMLDDLADQPGSWAGEQPGQENRCAPTDDSPLAHALGIVATGGRWRPMGGAFDGYLSLMTDLRSHLRRRLSTWPMCRPWAPDVARWVTRLTVAMRIGAHWNRHLTLPQRTDGLAWTFTDFVAAMAPPIQTYFYGLLNLMLLEEDVQAQSPAILRVLLAGEQYLVMSNWLATWEVEVADRDFTSGVVFWALERQVVSRHHLRNDDPLSIVRRLRQSAFRRDFSTAMARFMDQILNQRHRVSAFDVGGYMDGLQRAHDLHQRHREMLKC